MAALPEAVAVNLDWVPAGARGEVFTVITTQGETLDFYDAAGNRIFEGGDHVKGSRTFLKGEERVVGYQDEDFFAFASELQAFYALPGFDRTIDRETMADYLLPATDMLERADFPASHMALQEDPHAMYTPAVVAPLIRR